MSDLTDALLRIRHLVREQHTERLDDVAREIWDLTGEALAALMPSATSARSTHAIEAARSIVAASERERPGNDWWGVQIARRHVEGLLAEIDRLRRPDVAGLSAALLPLVESILEKTGELSLGSLPDDVVETVGLIQADADAFRYQFERLIWKPAQEAESRG